MKNCIKNFAGVLIALVSFSLHGAKGFTETYETKPCSDAKQITDMLIGPGVALHPTGWILPQTAPGQVGVFSNLVAAVIPTFTNGVILSTGKITAGCSLTNQFPAKKWEDDACTETSGTDKDLDHCFDDKPHSDPAGVVLYIQPKNKTINIPFVMASEEFFRQSPDFPSKIDEPLTYDKPTLRKYKSESDKFAFFLEELCNAVDGVKDSGSQMTNNIARLPNGDYIEIATVNQYTNTEYFISNVVTNEDKTLVFPASDINLPMEYNGAVVGPVAIASVESDKIYKLKIVVGDAYDNTFNTVIFLRACGITSGADLKIDVTGPKFMSEAPCEATFTNTVSNIGPATADGVVVTNYLPIGAVFKSNTLSSGSVESITVGGMTNGFVWTIGNRFAPGSNAVMTVTCNLENPGTYTNSAMVVTSTGDYDESNNRDECSTVVAAPDTTPMEFVVDKLTKMYDGTDLLPTYSYTTNALAEGHKLTEVVFDVASIRDVGKTNVNIVGFTVKEGDTVVTSKYTPVYTAGSLEVTKRKVALTSASAEKIYDGHPLVTNEVKVAGDGFVVGEGATYAVTGTRTVVGESDNVFSYEFNEGTKQGNYDVDTACGKLKVTAIVNPIVITVQGSSKKYDGTALTDESASFNYTQGVLAGEDRLDVTLTDASITDVGTSNVMVKTYKVLNGETDVTDCYTFGNSTTGTLEVLRREVTLTSASAEKTYDGTPLTTNKVEVSGDGFADPEGATYTVTGSQTDVGKAANAFTYKLLDNTKAINYNIACVTGELEVTRGVTPITITVSRLTKQYDRQPLKATWKIEGAPVGSDELIVTPSIESITDVGSNDVTVTCKVMHGTTDITEDYKNKITIVPGSLEVTKRPLEITARNGQKDYGRSLAFAGKEYTITGGKLLAGDSITKVTLQSEGRVKAAPYTPKGYPITITDVKGNGLKNYEITCVPGTLMLKKLPITITANDTNKVYGAEVNFAGTEFAITDGTLVNGDTVTNVKLTSEGAVKEKPWTEDGYPIVADYPVGGKGVGNYDITFSNGTLTVAKMPITIIASNTNKVYGTSLTVTNTAFSVWVREPGQTELPNGDKVETVTMTCPAALAESTAVGTYVTNIIPSHVITGNAGFSTNNYEIAFSNGTLTVTKAALMIIASDTNKVYGTTLTVTNTAFTTLPKELPNGDAVETVTMTCPEAESAATDAGTYVTNIVPSHVVTGNESFKTNNYEIAFSNGTLTVTKAALMIIASDTNKVYGTTLTVTNTAFTTLPETLPNGDAVETVTMTSPEAESAETDAGTYVTNIVPSHVVTGNESFKTNNYEIAFSNGTLTVTKAALMIIANDTNKVYGTELTVTNTAFTTLPKELPNGDVVETVTMTSPEAESAATEAGTHKGVIAPSHEVTGNESFSTNNYEIAFSNGTLTVTKAALTIAVDDFKWRIGKERPGDSDYSFSISPDQLKAGDTVVQITGGNVNYTNAVWTEEHAKPTYADKGRYENEIWIDLSRLSGTRAKNYDISVDPGALEIASAEVKFEVALSGEENGLGVQELTLTITNMGDPIDTDYDYWVELMPGTNETGKLVYCICKGMRVSKDYKFSPIRTAKMGDGSDYIDLTSEVTNALWTTVGDRNGIFDKGEVVTITGISFYYSAEWGARHDIMSVLGGDASSFIKAGRLFNVADIDKDFDIDDDEKVKAGWLLGKSAADYLEVTRLALLRYYHWDAKEGTWVGPSK